MHISFTVPMWALIGFGSIAYPSLGAMVSSLLTRTSNKRLPGFVVAAAGAAWPVTLSLGVLGFIPWLAGWLVMNYGGAIASVLRGKKSVMDSDTQFTLGQQVVVIHNTGTICQGWGGRIVDQKSGFVQIDFGSQSGWVPIDMVRAS